MMGSLAEGVKSFCDVSIPDKQKSVLTLQWLIVIGTSYLSLFSGGQINYDARVFALITALLLSTLVLRRLSREVFDEPHFDIALVILDGALILIGIGLNRESPWDLFLLFSLCAYIAGIAENLAKAVLGGLLLSVGFTFVAHSTGKNLWLDSEMLIRVPFFFGVSGLFGFLANQVKLEKQRADEAARSMTVRRRLVSGLAHDIKSPLSVIKGYAEVVGASLVGVPGQEYSLGAAQRIQENIERILRLVNGFLDASKADSGENQRLETPVALNWLIHEVARQHAVDLRQNNLTLDLQLDANLPETLGDIPQLERVIWNIMSNAIKFTPVNGTITISTEADLEQVRLIFRDTGIGIAKDELSTLFSEFGRLKAASSTEGSGLGLYIVKNIVEAHGGAVAVESELGKGTSFILSFPVARKLEAFAVARDG